MKEDLEHVLVALSEKHSTSVLMASVEGQDATQFAKLIMTKKLAAHFDEIVLNFLTKLLADLTLESVVSVPYDTGRKADSHELQTMNLDDFPEIKQQVAQIPVPVDAPIFDSTNEFVSGLHYYVVVIESSNDRYLFFRKCSPKSELGRSSSFTAIFERGTYDIVKENAIFFDEKIDCFLVNGKLQITHQHNTQNIFRYFEMLRKTAAESLERIRATVPIANFDAFVETCNSHLSKLAKLRNIALKPYLKNVTMLDLKKVIKEFDLNIKVEKIEGVESLVFDESDRWAILKLLDDDYLGSAMTQIQYEVNSKRQLRK